MQKLLNLIRSHLFAFAFISFALGDWSKKILLGIISENVLPVFSSGSFMMSCFIFRCLNYFEFIFVSGVEDVLLHVDIQFSQSILLKRLSFPYWIVLHPYGKSIDHIWQDFFSRFSTLLAWFVHLSFCWYYTVLIMVAL